MMQPNTWKLVASSIGYSFVVCTIRGPYKRNMTQVYCHVEGTLDISEDKISQ